MPRDLNIQPRELGIEEVFDRASKVGGDGLTDLMRMIAQAPAEFGKMRREKAKKGAYQRLLSKGEVSPELDVGSADEAQAIEKVRSSRMQDQPLPQDVADTVNAQIGNPRGTPLSQREAFAAIRARAARGNPRPPKEPSALDRLLTGGKGGAQPASGRRVRVVNPQGVSGTVPEEKLQEKLAQGYKRAQ